MFTRRLFCAGEEVLKFFGEVFRENELLDEAHSIQISADLYLGPSGDLDDYVNHSCEPNCGLRVVGDDLLLVAIQEIKPEEELFFDYATCVGVSDSWTMECSCGKSSCRKTISRFIDIPSDRQKKYHDLKVVPPFVLPR